MWQININFGHRPVHIFLLHLKSQWMFVTQLSYANDENFDFTEELIGVEPLKGCRYFWKVKTVHRKLQLRPEKTW
jgi:hypothetical protein